MDARLAAPASKQEIKLADYQSPAFTVDHTNLTFELFDEYAKVVARSLFQQRDDRYPDLVLDGGPYMDLLSVKLDGRVLGEEEYEVSAESLTLFNVPDGFELVVETRLKPHENTRLEGLYFSGGNFCTQCEAEGFRHITYFLDRPDVLTTYLVRIEADKEACPVLLSNGNPGATGDLVNGRHYAEWHDPHPKPCYLFALVAGDLACVSDTYQTSEGREVTLNVYVAPTDVEKSDHALVSLKCSMEWDEQRFGLSYDLDVYNIVAISDFNMGAMENKGLNIFNTKYVLASPETATDTDFDNIEGIIGHEYFHNWTGNRVTCRDWFQLSLKEGLTVFRDQEFSADCGSREIKRLDDVRTLRMLQFPEDAGPLAHPIRPEKYVEINNFYTATVYNKGAEVIRMMHTLIGEAAFRRGMDLYFERHDGQAVTCEDFVCAMEDASGVDLTQFRLWYSQAGTPCVSVSRRRAGNKLYLTLEQSCPATPGQPVKSANHMPILIGWLNEEGEQIQPGFIGQGRWQEDGCLLELTSSVQVFEFTDVPEKAVPSLLRGFTAPVVLKDDLTPHERAFLMQHDTDGFARWEAAQVLAKEALLNSIDGSSQNDAVEVLREAFSSILDQAKQNPALTAELLQLPGEIEVGQGMAVLDPAAVHASREALIAELAQENRAATLRLYDSLNEEEYSLDADQKARRRLRNTLLSFIARLEDSEGVVKAHYDAANNMTDRMAALNLIVSSRYECRAAILQSFYEDWKHDPLVVDKWFAVQANSSRHDVLETVIQLTKHEAFVIKNPNRLRSLVSTFAMLNQFGFHSEGGDGYTFLADMIVQVDALNPQTAARLVAPLGRWGRMNNDAASKMKNALEAILSMGSVSDDVRELCEKSLT